MKDEVVVTETRSGMTGKNYVKITIFPYIRKQIERTYMIILYSRRNRSKRVHLRDLPAEWIGFKLFFSTIFFNIIPFQLIDILQNDGKNALDKFHGIFQETEMSSTPMIIIYFDCTYLLKSITTC